MMYRFSSYVLALLLLVASGQAMAVSTLYSKVADPSFATFAASDWSDVACNTTLATMTNTTATAFANTDILHICGTDGAAAGAVVAGAAITVASLTVHAGATVNFGANIVTLSAGLINQGGTITTGAATHVIESITNTAGSTDLTTATQTTIAGAVTLTAGTLVLPSGLTTITGALTYTAGTLTIGASLATVTGLFTSAANFSMPSTVTALNGGVTVSGGTLTLAAVNIVAGTVTLNTGGNIAGVLKLKNTAHTITADAAKTIPALDLTALATAAVAITFNPVGGSLTATLVTTTLPASSTLVCGNSGVPSFTGTITATLANNASGSYICAIPSTTVPAPIFSTKEKAKVFSEGVNH